MFRPTLERLKSRHTLKGRVADFFTKIQYNGVSPAEVQVIHHLKWTLDTDLDRRIRSLQTLLELDYLPASTLACRELVARCRVANPGEKQYRQNDELIQLLYHSMPLARWRPQSEDPSDVEV